MSCVWIILIVIAYLVIAIGTGLFIIWSAQLDKEFSMFGILWPVVLPMFLIYFICTRIYNKFF